MDGRISAWSERRRIWELSANWIFALPEVLASKITVPSNLATIKVGDWVGTGLLTGAVVGVGALVGESDPGVGVTAKAAQFTVFGPFANPVCNNGPPGSFLSLRLPSESILIPKAVTVLCCPAKNCSLGL